MSFKQFQITASHVLMPLQVEKCKACTSDSLSDPRPECEEDFDDDKVPSTACSEEFGNDFCYVSMIRNKADQSTTWNSNKRLKDGCRLYINLLQEAVVPSRLGVTSAPSMSLTM